MKKRLLFILFLPVFIFSQTFTNSAGGVIPDDNTVNDYPVTVSGLPGAITSGTFGLEKVEVNIAHPSVGDLRLRLISPDGTNYILSSFVGGTGDNYTGTIFMDTANISIAAGSPPFTGIYKPDDALANYNNGQDPNGTWYLRLRDANAGDQGSLISFSITFGNSPAGSVNFTSSDLPIIVINTNGQQIQDGIETVGNMGIIYNGPALRNYLTDPFNQYNNKITIEIRGQSSTMFDQKQYHIETKDSFLNNIDAPIFAMPEENDWVLYAPYTDKTLMRNVLTYKLARDMGEWAAHTRFCEVVINGEYIGVYVWMEKIKRDKDRVAVKKLSPTDTSGINVTGGYIFSIDKDPPDWFSPFPPDSSTAGQMIGFHYVYPKPNDILPQQSAYLQAYVDSFEQAFSSVNFQDPLTGYRKYANVKSFSDFFILNEISNNVDGYRLSTYMHKNKITQGGQIKAGPAWDFNLAWHNADYCSGDLYNVWAYKFNETCSGDNWQVPFWWNKLVADSAFQKTTYCKWQQLRATYLDTVNLFAVIDSMANEVNEGKDRHYQKYPILGNYVWPNPSPLAATYAEEIRNTKDWIINRLNWLDSNMIGSGPCPDPDVSVGEAGKNISVRTYPNPFSDKLSVTLDIATEERYVIELFDMTGKRVATVTDELFYPDQFTFVLNLRPYSLKKGIYLLRVSGNGISHSHKIIKGE